MPDSSPSRTAAPNGDPVVSSRRGRLDAARQELSDAIGRGGVYALGRSKNDMNPRALELLKRGWDREY